MAEADLAALLLTTEPEVRYFTGYLTRFWESPTRPWFLIVPAAGKPIAVIPTIGAALMGQAWIDDIRTWRAPDLDDDGVFLLIDTLNEVAKGGRVAIPHGHETHVRMPHASLTRIGEAVGLVSDEGIMRSLRMVKTDAEIAKVAEACAIAGRAFARVPEIADAGTSLEHIFRQFQMLCLEEGADWVPYLAGGAGQGGYGDVISPATDAPLAKGDVLMLDTGLVHDGYFCDYDRNWSVGPASTQVKDAFARLITAVDVAFDTAKPGVTAADLYHAMHAVLSNGAGDTDAGRLGHGLGMSLTEWPSLIPRDDTVLETGMILTLEPGIAVGDKILVHEENIVITENGARFLSPRSGRELPVL
ncbi:Xaa-Pro aminopeptidase [Yoonia litorea]|uniref:Xaa-Pro aminopeptidase n=2 Tax=Yoonia litorea TaxID=1123755 RepID=A0A1I6L5F0_9RHOB|nr:Xaa-Pro aminopeptidase [Yoonia litorea]